ncbi:MULTISPECIES: hypothetical protein [unclassified Nocardioides]|uniref:hypothetical protein n=1 Tax=unclassified Nocardioides TaxID=2615069 RepID=UPI0006F9CDF0|nr:MULTISPECIES: hypothetical protein [unclassified Nocardioides]KRA37942.1 hypothetical protein ASD81_04460 [Nocardioides sp. Root614]KRA91902.1 hypothetical protein ASD84_04725 [Nocardioides sp. Root682]
MASIHHVDDERAARTLADLLNGNARKRPTVVVTIPAGRDEPWIDVAEVAQEAGALADVYLIPTGGFTWEFSSHMADGTQVYGGAGRVYPTGHDWASDLTKSPLRFAFNAADGRRATEQLISDTFRMASAAGLLQQVPRHTLREVHGTVKMLIAGRALVDIGNPLPATVPEELTIQDVPIARILAKGQRVDGWYDPESKRIDITKGLRPSDVALASYSVGDVVLTKVVMVRNGKAELMLYPKTTTPAVIAAVLRADVTTNPADDLRTLMTVGEVIPARIVATSPQWALVLNDVDDDEQVLDAPSLLAGGPPWLVEDSEPVDLAEPPTLAPPPPPPPLPSAAPGAAVALPPTVEPQSPSRPSPVMFDRNRAHPGPPPARVAQPHTQPSESTKALLLKVDGLTAEVAGLKREQELLRSQVAAGADEREQVRYLMDQAERRANKSEHDLKAARSRLRKAGSTKSGPPSGNGPQFADAEQGFRYLVLSKWATRTLPSEQASRPLGDYTLGLRFLDSLHNLEGIQEEKVADVVFEIVTGLATRLHGREVHHLRSGTGGDDPVRTRDDGAIAWRASLQVNTPSARRIHYWELPNGQVELARVTNHDDFEI